ncbi:aldehyde dehydrogenase, dimeric NADP-preferring [Gamsiella multidivaricata]|uniref:aldehyde dehydrogenase, dimeric NADP-preferring n=1 Tax=Gamsiella multidivaricata TaxID=101098 RepID=UPI0022205CD6|nr:aldehyde dehydrogenase, dimeric NADP-preferring [Gamsiella multidivaricata]KAI7831520.1 aldehyde dehydrogenase, dimeric NADP-preferring [Gamsiella multidivaricata]
MSLTFTPMSEIPKIVQGLRSTFSANLTKPLEYRKQQLRGLYNLLAENDAAIREAVFNDLHKSPQELMIGESGVLKQECIDAIKNLDKWAANRSVKTSIVNKFDNVHIRKDPLGMVLIIGAWNYPLNLLLAPAVGAIAAGNTVLLKPSEVAPHTAVLLTKLLPMYLDQRAYRIVNGGPEETTLLLEHKFDHIFFTGSGQVGRVIMMAAAKQLTSVTLELGGKSPTFIARDVDIAITARRLCWGKFFNCGQTCIAPDYVIVERGIEDKLLEACKASIQEFYGSAVQASSSYGRIVNASHVRRLRGLLSETKGQKIVLGGEIDEEDRFFPPTFVMGVEKGDKLMEGEIFGPILPIMVVDRLVEGVKYVNSMDQPLALYVFSKNKKAIDYILDHTRSGGVVVNDALVHFIVSNLPFGGTGPSGIGNYHGKRSFDVFSHERSALIKTMGMEKLLDLRYPVRQPLFFFFFFNILTAYTQVSKHSDFLLLLLLFIYFYGRK